MEKQFKTTCDVKVMQKVCINRLVKKLLDSSEQKIV